MTKLTSILDRVANLVEKNMASVDRKLVAQFVSACDKLADSIDRSASMDRFNVDRVIAVRNVLVEYKFADSPKKTVPFGDIGNFLGHREGVNVKRLPSGNYNLYLNADFPETWYDVPADAIEFQGTKRPIR